MTGCAARATATHTPHPTGASGSAPCQPAPVPRANAITTTPPRASSFAAVTTFCTHRPDATPTRLIPVNSATSPTPIGAMSAGGRPESRTRNSPAATPIAAIATPLVPRASTQPTTKPARGPNASRTKTYLPAARGWRVVSSAKHSAPRNASAAPSTQATKVSPGRPSRAATGRARSAPPPPAAAAPAAAPAPPPLGSRPRAFTISPAAPRGRARRGRRAVGTVTAVTYLPTIPRRECHPVTAATLHRIALAHARRVGPPPGDQRAIGDAEPRAHGAHRRVRAEPAPEGHLGPGA